MRIPPEILDYYNEGREHERLARGAGRLEAVRTLELLRRWLPPPPARIVDVGGASGRYAMALAENGYEVHLVDPVQLHVDLAAEASRQAASPLASVRTGDARALDLSDAAVDAVLLLGPLYHLPGREDRLAALREAARVLTVDGVAVIAAISRFASTADGIVSGQLRDPRFADMVARDVADGIHRNHDRRAGWFTTSYFHRPDDLAAEVVAAGLTPDGPVAVEGLGAFAPDIDALLDDPTRRERSLAALRRVEREPSILGASPHLLIAGRRRA